MTINAPENERDLVNYWFKRIRESQFAHYEAAKIYSKRDYCLGIPVVILTAFAGTSVFATLQSKPCLGFKIFIGLVIVSSTVLASLQTFLKYAERAEKHRAIASKYGAIRREIEIILSTNDYNIDKINQIKDRIDDLASDSPEFSNKIWKSIESTLKNRDTEGS